jgi:hypothetical protein
MLESNSKVSKIYRFDDVDNLQYCDSYDSKVFCFFIFSQHLHDCVINITVINIFNRECMTAIVHAKNAVRLRLVVSAVRYLKLTGYGGRW